MTNEERIVKLEKEVADLKEIISNLSRHIYYVTNDYDNEESTADITEVINDLQKWANND